MIGSRRTRPALRRAATAVAVVVVAVAAALGTDAHAGATGADGRVAPGPPAARATVRSTWQVGDLPLLHATRGANPGIVDAHGRQVVLRGVNLNSLGDYAVANPAYPVTALPVTAADWDRMAAQGFNSVRLLVSWSRLEPSPGAIDASYLVEIHQAVDDAAARGIYSIIDMHQDAWGKYIATPPGATCPAGLHPAIGWDGAPEWATITDGAETCNGGSREDSEAVRTAWDSFWSDRDGIQTHLVDVWARLATEFAGDPAVAGYDLLNEPNSGHGTDMKTALGAYYARAIAAIRQAEVAGGHGGAGHIAFFEYSVDGVAVDPAFTTDTNLVFAPHIYGGSIAPLTVEQNWAYASSLASAYQTTIWSGEYGWFSDPQGNLPKLTTFGQLEDQDVAGSAWWQWRQACGDPHSIGSPGGTPPPLLVHYQYNGCPGDVNGGVVPQWRTVVARPYPRGLPGRITHLESNGAAGTLVADGTVADGASGQARSLLVWVPDTAGPPTVGGRSIADVHVQPVTGGYLVTATTCATTYEIQVGSFASPVGPTCSSTPAVTPTSSPGGGAGGTPGGAGSPYTGQDADVTGPGTTSPYPAAAPATPYAGTAGYTG